jgi:hypothetical protein
MTAPNKHPTLQELRRDIIAAFLMLIAVMLLYPLLTWLPG